MVLGPHRQKVVSKKVSPKLGRVWQLHTLCARFVMQPHRYGESKNGTKMDFEFIPMHLILRQEPTARRRKGSNSYHVGRVNAEGGPVSAQVGHIHIAAAVATALTARIEPNQAHHMHCARADPEVDPAQSLNRVIAEG